MDIILNNYPLRHFGSLQIPCSATNKNAYARDHMITSMKTYGWDTTNGFVFLTDEDTIYTNGVLYSAPQPTHYVSLSLGFVPPELMDLFDTWISTISSQLFNHLAPLPNPWIYVKTTYERAENAFRIWLRLPQTATASVMVMGFLDDLMNFLSIWVPVVLGVISVIIGTALIATGGLLALGWVVALGLLIGGAAVLVWKIQELSTAKVIAEEKANNYDIQVNVFTNFDNSKENLSKAWEASQKTPADCSTRLTGYTNLYLTSVIDTYIKKYSKYSALTTELQAERADITDSLKRYHCRVQNKIIHSRSLRYILYSAR